MLRRSKRSKDGQGTPPPGRFDLPVTDPALAAAADHLVRHGDPEPLHGRLQAADPGHQAAQARDVAEHLTDRAPIDAWVATHGAGSPLPWAVLSLWHVEQGWAIRGGGYSPQLDAYERDRFFQHLRDADAAAWCGHVADPQSALPWATTFAPGLGLEIPKEELIARHDRIAQLGVEVPMADLGLLQALAPKWGGSEALMFAYARQLAEQAAPGSPRQILPCIAHLEALIGFDDKNGREFYREQPKRQEEIRGHITRYFDGLLSAAPHTHPIGLNPATVVASQFGLTDLAVRGHQLIGDRYQPFPWYYLGDAERAIAKDRSRYRLGPL